MVAWWFELADKEFYPKLAQPVSLSWNLIPNVGLKIVRQGEKWKDKTAKKKKRIDKIN